jgi:hypothetical protein
MINANTATTVTVCITAEVTVCGGNRRKAPAIESTAPVRI